MNDLTNEKKDRCQRYRKYLISKTVKLIYHTSKICKNQKEPNKNLHDCKFYLLEVIKERNYENKS